MQQLLPDGAQAIIPPFPNVLTDTLPIDAGSYFEEMTLNEGQLTISLYNGLPSDLANINLVLRNEGSNSNIIQIILPLLPSGSTHQKVLTEWRNAIRGIRCGNNQYRYGRY